MREDRRDEDRSAGEVISRNNKEKPFQDKEKQVATDKGSEATKDKEQPAQVSDAEAKEEDD